MPLNPEILEALSKKGLETLSYLKGLPNSLPFLSYLEKDISYLEEHVNHFKMFKDVIVLGTGGSSLGAQTLVALRKATKPTIHFLDNIDPHTFQNLIDKVELKNTGVIAISKSGNTAETLTQLLSCLSLWEEKYHSTNFLLITENKNNAMKEIQQTFSLRCLDHPEDVGGRFSIFTLVALLPALIAGIDVNAFKAGAWEVINALLETNDINQCSPLMGALLNVSLQKQGFSQTVLFVYCDRLIPFTKWFRQLWAESLGKKDAKGNPCGSTPISAIGTIDQHSQLQLYLDGPQDKFFTFITLEEQKEILFTFKQSFNHPILKTLSKHSLGDLIKAEQKATFDTLKNHHCPLRHLSIHSLNEETLGFLVMHFFLETLATAFLLNINPFNQPAVEEGKTLTFQYIDS